MSEMALSNNDGWKKRWTFFLAAVGSAVGLGNIWKFSYIAGENGGGAFVFVYFLCLLLVGLPILVAEIAVGRCAQTNAVQGMAKLAKQADATPKWSLVALTGILSSIAILSYYSVIAGWSLDYVWNIAVGNHTDLSKESATVLFSDLTQDPYRMLLTHTIFMIITAAIVAPGIHEGLERGLQLIMPLLFFILVFLLGYVALTNSHFQQGLAFLFKPDFSKLTWNSVLAAMGQAFFTLTVGICIIMTYSAYMPKKESIVKTASMVCIADTAVALIAGMIIFPIIFSQGIKPTEGPGLLFISMPTAFSHIVGGQILGTLFFILIAITALSSAISLLENPVSWLTQAYGWNRAMLTIILSIAIWALGIGSILSFNLWSDESHKFLGMTFFELLDFTTQNIVMPAGGILIAIFAGWIVKRSLIYKELNLSAVRFNIWRALCRVIAPACILTIFTVNLLR